MILKKYNFFVLKSDGVNVQGVWKGKSTRPGKIKRIIKKDLGLKDEEVSIIQIFKINS